MKRVFLIMFLVPSRSRHSVSAIIVDYSEIHKYIVWSKNRVGFFNWAWLRMLEKFVHKIVECLNPNLWIINLPSGYFWIKFINNFYSYMKEFCFEFSGKDFILLQQKDMKIFLRSSIFLTFHQYVNQLTIYWWLEEFL